MEQKYYFITVFNNYDEQYGPWSMRTWGFYTHLEDAIKALNENMTDLWETCYNYAVIEEYIEGIGGYNFNRQFFHYDRGINSYRLMDEPVELKHYCSFAIG